MYLNVSIDRLTFCGNSNGSLEVFTSNNQYIERNGFAKYPYRDFVKFIDGSILQIAEKGAVNQGKIKELRYEFNPNNQIYEKVHLSAIKMLKDAHCTRIDVAIDFFDLDMSYWRWLDKKSRPMNLWLDGQGRVETVYIGGVNSNLRIRIYNKAVEQKEKNKTWWRVEVQMRGDIAEQYRVLSRSFKGLRPFNPFDDIVPVVNTNLGDLPIQERAMLSYLFENPSGFSEMSAMTRRKYKKMLMERCKCDLIDLKKIWYEKSSDVGSELDSWYSFTGETFL